MLVAFELMHYLDHKREGKDSFMAVKLDMSKVYDKVEWVFIEKIMERMGFHKKMDKHDHAMYLYCVIFYPYKWCFLWLYKA